MKKNIIKADGRSEPFDEQKINRSFIKAGASPEIAREATKTIYRKIRNNMNTNEIFNKALDHLKILEPKVALKYSLRRAIMDMGPEGFVFEKYTARILKEYGFTVEVGQFLNGYCVEHEVDVVAKKGDRICLVECKYHNSPGIKSDIKTALYVHSRFLDIDKAYRKSNKTNHSPIEAWLVTNTKCSSDAIKYASCVNLKILAWHYPKVENLQYFIETRKLYPISILPTITGKQKERLFDSNIIMVRELANYGIDNLAELLSINYRRAEKILNEIKLII